MAPGYELHKPHGTDYPKYDSDVNIKLEEPIVQSEAFLESKIGIPSISEGVLFDNIKAENLNRGLIKDIGNTENYEFNSDKIATPKVEARSKNDEISPLQEYNIEVTIEYDETQEDYNYSDADIKVEDPIVQTVDIPVWKTRRAVKTQFTCARCGKNFKDKKSLSNHKIAHMFSRSSDDTMACPQCGKLFAGKSKLLRHTKSVHPVHACNYCERTFDQKMKLTLHVRTHTGEKPYTCKVCFKTFSSTAGLNNHLRVHTSKRRFTCEICNVGWTTKGGLTAHIKKHTGKRPFTCEMCKMSFSRTNHLRRHMEMHAGDCPYSCEACSAKFNSLRSVSAHMKLHTACRKEA